MLNRATALPGATWRAWNARGAVADGQGAWDAADAAYARAHALAPSSAEIANNRGWSLLLRGHWREAEAELARAAALAPAVPRIANNLDIARSAIAADLPLRRGGEDDSAWAARLNDAGVVAAMKGDRPRAIAAFARALELRASWDPRAAANLAAVEAKR
jgi:Flp pilus assembly protein TadD